MSDTKPETPDTSPAGQVIKKMGGLTKLAQGLGIAVSTVQGWKERGEIPQRHWLPIMNVAKAAGIPLALHEFVGATENAA